MAAESRSADASERWRHGTVAAGRHRLEPGRSPADAGIFLRARGIFQTPAARGSRGQAQAAVLSSLLPPTTNTPSLLRSPPNPSVRPAYVLNRTPRTQKHIVLNLLSLPPHPSPNQRPRSAQDCRLPPSHPVGRLAAPINTSPTSFVPPLPSTFPAGEEVESQVEPHQQHARSLDLPRPPDQLVNRSRRPGTARSSYLCSCPAPQRVSALSPAQKILTPLSHPTHPPLPNVSLHGLWSDSASSNVVPGRRRTGRATWVSPCAGLHRPSPPLLARQHLARHQRPRVWDTPRPLLSFLAKIFCATDIQNEPAPRTQHSTCGPASAPSQQRPPPPFMQSHRRARPRTRRASSLQDASLLGLGTSPLLPAAEEKQGHGRSQSAAACASSSYLTPPLTLRAFVLPLVVPFPRAVYQSPLGRVARVTERPRPSVPRAHRSRRQQRASPSAALGAPCALRPRLLLVHHGPAPTPLLVVWPGPGQEPRSCPPPFFPALRCPSPLQPCWGRERPRRRSTLPPLVLGRRSVSRLACALTVPCPPPVAALLVVRPLRGPLLDDMPTLPFHLARACAPAPSRARSPARTSGKKPS